MKKGKQTAKRLLSFVMALAMVLTLLPATVFAADADTTLYLVPNANWKVDNARFAMVLATSNWSTSTWVDMADADGDGYYEGTIPSDGNDYSIVIFCRMNPNSTTNGWDNKWNQTADLTLPTDGSNCYTVAEGTWDSGGGTWSAYTPKVEETTPSEPEEETITVYFRNDWLWPEVNVHYWSDSQGTTWPGEVMTFVETTSAGDVYSAEIPTWATGMLFSGIENGKTGEDYRQQTPNITDFADGDAFYIHWDGANAVSKFDYTPAGEETDPTDPVDPTDPPATEATYIVAGTAGLCGSGWNPGDTANKMTLNAETGLYEITYARVLSGTHEFKVTDGTWDNSWGKDGGKDNYSFTLDAISKVTITFNAATKEIQVATEATGEVLVTADYQVTLHFLDTLKWGTVNLYAWTDDSVNPSGGWPGTALTKDQDGFYTTTLTYTAQAGQGLNYIYNNGSAQTADLELGAELFEVDENGVYCMEKWIALISTSVADVADTPEALVTASPLVDGTSVTFFYKNANAQSVSVRGSMNDWGETAMTANEYGVWSVTIDDLAPGSYEYKFYVDGTWVADPLNAPAQEDGNSTFLILDPNAEDTNTVTINIHYTRTKADYEGWNLWTWNSKIGGHQEDFTTTDENGAVVATIVLENAREYQNLNFIPRYSVEGNEWKAQEATFVVDISDIVSGTVDYYVTEGSTAGTLVLGTDVVKATKLLSCELDYDNGTIQIVSGSEIEDPEHEFEVVESDGAEDFSVGAVGVNDEGTIHNVLLKAGQELDLVNLYKYRIKFQGFTYAININNVYATDKFAEEFTYTGNDLGATWSAASTKFVVWAPTAAAVSVNLYTSGTEGTDDLIKSVPMTAGANGSWAVTVEGDLNGTYYTYAVTVNGETVEAVDPYARTTGVNGNRGMVIDLDSTDPAGWDADKNPNPITSYTDAVIYELHVRDFSIDDSSGVSASNRGKYLAFTEEGTTTANGVTTGIDYLDELGITHLHLLPVYDYASVDETTCSNFNWGYDPQNYNAPEGSYSTDPYNGAVRVNEFKQMVKSLHDHDISVIMDVVYNHVYNADTFCYNNIVPGYFSRYQSNTSGCGNDTASEREMVRKYIVESVLYWHQEYHIDGFRFDLVGLLDVETINQIVEEVHACCPDVIFYGEGWNMDSTNKEEGTEMAKQGNADITPGFGYFSDSIRNQLAGSNGTSTGFVSGGGIGSLVAYYLAKPESWGETWTTNPQQVVQYASCHDNYTLIDKLVISTGASGLTDDIISMNNLTAVIYMTSQGIPFIHAGEEFLREKLEEGGGRCENSYNASDYVNHIEWSNLEKETYANNSEYYKGLIEFRKAHAALRNGSAAEVAANVKNTLASGNVIAFRFDGNASGDDDIYVIFNANTTAQTVSLPEGTWTISVNKEKAGTASLGTAEGSVSVDGISAMVLTKADEGKDEEETPDTTGTITLYFSNNKHWESVYAYAWAGGEYPLGAWPGAAMTYVETNDYGEDIYCVTIPAGTEGIIFHNNSGAQTVDVTPGVDGTGYYCETESNGKWTCGTYVYRDPIGGGTGSADDYYLFGYINGADYGCNDDYATLGDYKFVDGKVTATFEADSYVGVKTGDNSAWYMTDGWCGSVTSATLYDTAVYTDIETFDKLMVPGGVEITFTLTVNDDDTVTLSYTTASTGAEDTSGIQDGVTLHCWNWSFAEIEANMATIAQQGYTAIQTSPVQPIKEATTSSTVGSHWWVYYQPVDFVISTDEGNVLGTKEDLVSMIETAHSYGVKVIVDVVANHLANQTGNDLSSAIPEYLLEDDYWHDITINTSDYTSRFETTQYCMGGLPDLNTANDDVQGFVLKFLQECIDAGVDGFRFDATKHIETPEDDASFASDFWPTVINGAESYAAETYGKDVYMYGEVLDAINGLPISAYTKYMSVTDNSWGNTLREEISSGTADMASGYDKMTDSSNLVIWAESHDTYANAGGGSADETEAEINMTWALVAARADAMGLYLARPASNEQLLGVASVTGWANAEVQAVNRFHNAFVGESEVIGNEGKVAYVERGDSGVVLVNAAGGSADVSVTANAVADGTYTDQLTGNTFTVADGKITGTIGDTGIAVVYNLPEPELFKLSGTTMTLSNSLAINFVIDTSKLEGTGHYAVITKAYADRDAVTVTIPQSQWAVYSGNLYYFTFKGVAAKEMNDLLTVDVYNSMGQKVTETYLDSVALYGVRAAEKELKKENPSETAVSMYVDMVNYGAAAQIEFEYDVNNLANSVLTEALKEYASSEVAVYDSLVKGTGYLGSTLLLKSEIQLNFVFANATIDQAAYAVVSFTNHYGNLKTVEIPASEFQAYGTVGKYISVTSMSVADCYADVTLTLYAEDGTVLSENVDSVEGYISRASAKSDLYAEIMKFADSAFKYFEETHK